jgi:membrane protease subunit HflK
VKASQDRERQINEGQAYANDVVPKARGSASRLMQESEGYKQRIIATAEGEASRFRQITTEYSRAPAVTRQRMYLDTMQQVLSSISKVIVDQKSGNNLLFLPLDKLLQLSAAAATVAPTDNVDRAPAADMQQAAPTVDPRSRDAFRARDREPRP